MTTKQFEQGVGLLMLAMGLSLTLDDFRQCLKQPVPIVLGFICQYSILPLLAFTISRLMNLPPSVACGMIILGSCPVGIDVVVGRPAGACTPHALHPLHAPPPPRTPS